MKKIILSLLCAGAVTSAANAQVAIAPELGLNMANMALKMTDPVSGTSMTISSSMKAGLAIGGIVEFGFSDNLSLQPGLFYLMNGCNVSGGSYNIGTLQIPINVEYKLGDPGDNRFFFGAGPYIGYNLSAKAKGGGSTTTIDIGTDKTKDGLKPMDIGLGVNVGYLLSSGLFFRAHYQFGFTDMAPDSDHNSIKSSAIGVTVGYYLVGNSTKKGGKGKKK